VSFRSPVLCLSAARNAAQHQIAGSPPHPRRSKGDPGRPVSRLYCCSKRSIDSSLQADGRKMCLIGIVPRTDKSRHDSGYTPLFCCPGVEMSGLCVSQCVTVCYSAWEYYIVAGEYRFMQTCSGIEIDVLGTLLLEDLPGATLKEVDSMAESRYHPNTLSSHRPSDSVISTDDSRYPSGNPLFPLKSHRTNPLCPLRWALCYWGFRLGCLWFGGNI
jgi:hypothetical protein